MLRLITDFDGPIMDVSERYYRAYQFCLAQTRTPNQSVTELPKAEFWQLKRLQTPETKIGLLSGLEPEQVEKFSQLRKKTVHTHPYFQYDTVVPGAIAALTQVQQAGLDLVVMTMRRVSELDYAFEQYHLGRFFSTDKRYCLSNTYVKTRDVEDKPLLMAKALQELPPAADIWMVGDTEADIAAAKKHNIKVIAVESGIRDRQKLELYQPDLIVKDLQAAVEIILS